MSHEEKENLPQLITYLKRLPRQLESPLNFSTIFFPMPPSKVTKASRRSHSPVSSPYHPSGSFTQDSFVGQDKPNLCTYPARIEHVGTSYKLIHISRGNWICRHGRRARDKDKDQGHPEARASPE